MANRIVNAYLKLKMRNIVANVALVINNLDELQYVKISNYDKCINGYYDDFICNRANVESIMESYQDFFTKYDIVYQTQKDIMYEIFDKMRDYDTIVRDERRVKAAIILSKVVLLAIYVEELTSSIVGKPLTMDEAVVKALRDYKSLIDDDMKNAYNKTQKKLRRNINGFSKKMSKFEKMYFGKPFNLDLIKVYELEENNTKVFDVKLDYDHSELKEYKKKDIEHILRKSNLIYDYTMATAEMLSYFTFKRIENYEIYVLHISDEIWKRQRYVQSVLSNFCNDLIKKRICLDISCETFLDRKEKIEEISKQGYMISISSVDKVSDSMKKVAKFISIGQTSIKEKANIEKFCHDNNISIIDLKSSKK